MNSPSIVAAGAVVLRRGCDPPQVLIIHRPRYDDWSLPKGKVERNEPPAVCAVREVAEETGISVRVTAPLHSHSYPTADGTKQVHWWVAEVVSEGEPAPGDDEVDQIRWVPIRTALDLLSYRDECDRLREAMAVPVTTPLLVLRHAKAQSRKDWDGPDVARPITGWGRRQSRALVPVFEAFGVRRVVSSAAVRCLQTVTPFTRSAGLGLEGWHELTEEVGETDPAGVTRAIEQLRRDVATSGTPTVVCGHRPLLPTMLAALDLPNHKFATAELQAVTLLTDLTVHASERIRVLT